MFTRNKTNNISDLGIPQHLQDFGQPVIKEHVIKPRLESASKVSACI